MTDPTIHEPAGEPQGDTLAKQIAAEVVQTLADSEPTERSMDGMQALKGTPMESMFVLDGDEIHRTVECVISNAFFDGALMDAAELKRYCTEFFRWWYNQPGSNTDQGYDEWVKQAFPILPTPEPQGEKCRVCKGKGGIEEYYDGDLESTDVCPRCHGTGTEPSEDAVRDEFEAWLTDYIDECGAMPEGKTMRDILNRVDGCYIDSTTLVAFRAYEAGRLARKGGVE